MTFILLQLQDILHRPRQNAPLILLAVRHDLGKFRDPIVNRLTTATFDFFVIIPALFMPFFAADGGAGWGVVSGAGGGLVGRVVVAVGGGANGLWDRISQGRGEGG